MEVVQNAAGMQLEITYMWRRQATVSHWGVLRPISEVCVGEKVYEGVDAGGKIGGAKRRQRNIFGSPWLESRGKLREGGDWDRALISRILM